MKKGISNICGSAIRSSAKICNGGIVLVEKSKNQNCKNRANRAKRNKTKTVGFGVFIASYIRNTKSKCKDKRNSHWSGCNAAGIERNGHKAARHEKRQHEHQQIKADQDSVQAPAEQVAQERQHQKQADADGNRQNQHQIRHARRLSRQNR